MAAARCAALLAALLLVEPSREALGPGGARRTLELRLRPKPPLISRPRIEKDFAVLLMRTSYQKCEEMRFVPMDQFQRSFFLLRQDEWQDYVKACEGLAPKQGDLQDPAYFDFISFAQYRTLEQAMREGKLAYVERVGAEGEEVSFERPADVPRDNAALPAEHSRRVGDTVLEWMRERYDVPGARSLDEVRSGVREILEIFRIQSFATATSVTAQPGAKPGAPATLRCSLVAPATLWSQKVLASAKLHNDFEAKAVDAYLRECGARSISCSTSVSDIAATHDFRFVLPSA